MKRTRNKWLIDLRWIAACGILLATYISDSLLHIPLQLKPLFSIAGVLLILNMFFLYLYNKIVKHQSIKAMSIEQLVIIQIITDLILLSFLLHYSGGVENPFIIYYIFHLMLASILLPRKTSYLLASFAILLVAILAFGEFRGWFRHYELKGFINIGFYNNIVYLTGTGFVFITTSYVVVYMTSTVSAILRVREHAYREANRELLNKDIIKDEYVFRITHDIKGHLGAIRNCLDVSLSDLPTEQKQDFVSRAYARTDKLIGFVQELLRITQLRLGNEMVFTEFSLKEEILELIGVYRNDAEQKGIRISTHLEIDHIVAGKLSIREVIENLITNAIKYTESGGKIEISGKKLPDGKIQIEVADTGIGIPKEESKKIFREFYRASNNTDGYTDGSGMGLAIVRIIVKNHKGSITVKSRKNKGSRFRLELPDLKDTLNKGNK